ncbi:heat shock protein Hsp20 [Anseongella ginsenosidimutans]|uniref:Heat shock protein Hsp20 n=1 Tax=Anseongella ginsenosidimutans TaxID=496056 RepID=A0A4R3KML9_9SPHI|nr:Hsp20/alpha crystallin family protein [Anseongella ginsenosidimutans]QEC52539.1 Hsp20/alpha crystallin family protein [Anseongella ginsenosidimutans]TCS85277.1 heat shock protein Hsp20 [Anseongella ginsenosidimutans]
MSLIRKQGRFSPTIPSVFDDFFDRELFNWGNNNFSSTSTTVPSVNIKENMDNFVVELAAPGMKKEDFEVSLDGNLLTISSQRRQEDEKRESGYTRREFSYQSFQRSFSLPKDVVDEDQIRATYKDGLLHLTIPKKEEAKRLAPRRIEIQ